VRADTVGFDFATFITEGGGVLVAKEDGLADVFERAPVLFEKLVYGQAVSVSVHCWFPIPARFNTLRAKESWSRNGRLR